MLDGRLLKAIYVDRLRILAKPPNLHRWQSYGVMTVSNITGSCQPWQVSDSQVWPTAQVLLYFQISDYTAHKQTCQLVMTFTTLNVTPWNYARYETRDNYSSFVRAIFFSLELELWKMFLTSSLTAMINRRLKLAISNLVQRQTIKLPARQVWHTDSRSAVAAHKKGADYYGYIRKVQDRQTIIVSSRTKITKTNINQTTPQSNTLTTKKKKFNRSRVKFENITMVVLKANWIDPFTETVV